MNSQCIRKSTARFFLYATPWQAKRQAEIGKKANTKQHP